MTWNKRLVNLMIGVNICTAFLIFWALIVYFLTEGVV